MMGGSVRYDMSNLRAWNVGDPLQTLEIKPRIEGEGRDLSYRRRI